MRVNSQREKRELKSERENIRDESTKIVSTFLLGVASLTSEFIYIVLGSIVYIYIYIHTPHP